jgi:hypothetical protein
MVYTMEYHNDAMSGRHFVNILRDGEMSAQAMAMTTDEIGKVGIFYSVLLDGNWSRTEFELTTLTEWVERFTK